MLRAWHVCPVWFSYPEGIRDNTKSLAAALRLRKKRLGPTRHWKYLPKTFVTGLFNKLCLRNAEVKKRHHEKIQHFFALIKIWRLNLIRSKCFFPIHETDSKEYSYKVNITVDLMFAGVNMFLARIRLIGPWRHYFHHRLRVSLRLLRLAETT